MNEPSRTNACRLPRRALALLAAALTGCSLPPGVAVAEGPDHPRLTESHLEYLGSFRVPRKDANGKKSSYGGRALAYNPGNNSLFITGHVREQLTAEISIPEIRRASSPGELAVGRFIQPFQDATGGRLDAVDPGDRNGIRIADHLVLGDRLYVSAYTYYDANGSQRASHFSRSLQLGDNLTLVGPVAVGDNVHYTSGYMTTIPEEWRKAFGAPALTGNCCRSIIGYHSHGPALYSFDPSAIGAASSLRVPADALLYYTSNRPLGPGETTSNPLFNLTTRVEGVIFPAGTRSVLFFGKHGTGTYCYGTGIDCGDPVRSQKGNHAHPYIYQVWAYDATDLLNVLHGRADPEQVQPYATWELNVPFERNDDHDNGGVAWDANSRTLYFSQIKGDGDRPLIHAFRVAIPSATN